MLRKAIYVGLILQRAGRHARGFIQIDQRQFIELFLEGTCPAFMLLPDEGSSEMLGCVINRSIV